ncbi:MAG TPA: zinc ribbon domain-containing protein [Candidatus Angelobacter sp.]|jgi:hypothetical protein
MIESEKQKIMCSNCTRQIDADLKVCPLCGSELKRLGQPEKDSYEFQRNRVVRLAAELGMKVEFDKSTTEIKFRATPEGTKFRPTTHSGELEPSELADKPDSWVKALIQKLARATS